MTERHVQKTDGRHYRGEPHGSEVARFLNGEPIAPQILARLKDADGGVVRLVKDAKDSPTTEALERIKNILLQPGRDREDPDTPTRWLANLVAATKQIAATYRWQLDIAPTKVDRRDWSLGFSPIYTIAEEFHVSITESKVVQDVAQLICERLVHLLRRCKQCDRWFFAHFKSQVFCTADCKQYFRYHSQEYKRDHREKEKKRYDYRKIKKARR